MHHYLSKFALQQRVSIDTDEAIIGTVTGIAFRVTRDPTIEVSWMHNGDAKSAWFEEWRLVEVL